MPDLKGRYGVAPRAWEATQAPATIGEVWDASRTLQSVDNSDANNRRMERTYAPLLAAVNAQRQREGLPPMQNPVLGLRTTDPRDVQAGTSAYGQAMTARVGQEAAQRDFYAELARIRQGQRDFLPEAGDNPAALMAKAVEAEKVKRAAARGVMDRSQGFASGATAFAGGASMAMEDPINLMGLAIGGGARTVVGTIAREFVVNGLLTAATQPQAARNRAVVGEELTLGEAAANVAMAGVAGGAIGGAAHAGGAALGRAWDGAMAQVYRALPDHLRAKWRDAATLPDDALADIAEAVTGDRMTPEVQDAVNVLRTQGQVAATSPYAPGIAGTDAHAERLANAMRAINEGRPAPSLRSRLQSGTTLAAGDVAGRSAGAPSSEPAMAGYMRAVRGAESSGNDAAAAATSSAYGRYQFTRGTWLRYYVRRFGREGLTDAQILAKRGDGGLQDTLMQDLSADSAAALRRAGHDVTAANLYTVHFAGPADAVRILDAPAEAPVRSVMRAESVAANPWLRDLTVGELRAKLARKVGDPVGGAAIGRAEDAPAASVRTDDLDAEAARLDDALARADDVAPTTNVVDAPDMPSSSEVVFRRKGDFYEVAGDQAEAISRTLGIAVTRDADGVPMVGLPAHTFARDAATLADAGMPTRVGASVAEERLRQNWAFAVEAGKEPKPAWVMRRKDGGDIVDWALSKPAMAKRMDREWNPDAFELVKLRPYDLPEPVAAPETMPATRADAAPPAAPVAESAIALPRDAAPADVFAPMDDYDLVAPALGDDPAPALTGKFEPDDPIWDAIDRHEARAAVEAVDREAMPDAVALTGYDDPHGAAAQVQRDSLLHDARTKLAVDPEMMVVSVDGSERRLADVIAELDEERAMIDTVRACL